MNKLCNKQLQNSALSLSLTPFSVNVWSIKFISLLGFADCSLKGIQLGSLLFETTRSGL